MDSRSSAPALALVDLHRDVRARTEALCAPLCIEDQVVQTMPDASPTKWHLAHTTWFFETFVLRLHAPGYVPLDERYAVLFNSYYHAAGERHPRPERGLLSRPTVAQVLAYRAHVDRAMRELLESGAAERSPELAFVIELGLNHEEQHQELILTDVKHVLASNPLHPVYRAARASTLAAPAEPAPIEWQRFDGGLVAIGRSSAEFCFDNERPLHRRWLEPFELATRPVTCSEWASFVEDGGYDRAELWMSDGWDARQRLGWEAPLYWQRRGGEWRVATLAGLRALAPAEPVCHVSWYEADAYARWRGARLPLEEEWEHAAARLTIDGRFLEDERFHPAPAPAGARGLAQMYGDVWEWTASPYAPYPGFEPFRGALGEYNGKFMSNRYVLRGGSCVTPRRHVRATYRNFFGPETRWQFAGVRLARSA